MSTLPIVINRSPNAQLYDTALLTAYSLGATWIPDPDYALQKDPAFYEKASRDCVLRTAIEDRLHRVGGRDPMVVARAKDPASTLKAQIHEALLDEVDMFAQSNYALSKAVLQGAAYGYIEGERRFLSLAGTKPEWWWVPTRIRDVNWRRMRYATGMEQDPENPEGPRKRQVWMEIFSLDGHSWGRVRDTSRLIRFIYDDEESGLNHGLGIGAALYHYFAFKAKAIEEGMAGLERWARGLITAGISPGEKGMINLDNKQLRAAWIRVLEGEAGRHVIVHDKNDEIKPHFGGAEGHQIAMDMVQYFDDSMTRLLDGSLRPTGGGKGGDGLGSNRAQVEQETTESLVGFDRRILWETITRDLGGLIERANEPQFASVGCADARQPRYRPAPSDVHDPAEGRETLDCAKRNGIPMRRADVYEILGVQAPDLAQDDVFDFAPEPQPGFGGGFGDSQPFGEPEPSMSFMQRGRVLAMRRPRLALPRRRLVGV